MEKLRYPIGHFECPKEITSEHIEKWIGILETLPARLETMVQNLSAEQLEHHIADSHHNSYTRFKWALTEDKPLIKAYEEKEWSNLFDARTAPIQLSLSYLTALHAKLVYLLKGLTKEDLEKFYLHPDGNVEVTVAENIGKYAWHSNHHFAHIEGLLNREGWIS